MRGFQLRGRLVVAYKTGMPPRNPAPTISFTARVDLLGINPFVPVSARRAARIRSGWRGPLPVLVRVNGEPRKAPWRINMMPVGDGDFRLYLHGDVRRASTTGVGDRVRVEVQFDAEYRNGPAHPMPSWFRAPLMANAKAKRGWDALIPSRKKEILRYLAGLSSAEARARNVLRALQVLSGRGGRYMGRDW